MPPARPADKKPDPIIIVKRARGGGGHGHHGGSWKVALADFMTSMMSLFIVLWLTQQDTAKKAAIAGYFRDPKGAAVAPASGLLPGALPLPTTPSMRPPAQAPGFQQLRELQQRIQVSLSEIPEFKGLMKHLEFEMTEEGLRISLSEDSLGVFFQAGRALPTPHAARFMAVLGQQLGTVSNQLVLEGHTDAMPYRGRGDGYSNWELSSDRANTARRIFEIGGTRPRQIVEVRGMADFRLRYPEQPTAPGNRRITVTVLSPEATARRERPVERVADSLLRTAPPATP